MRGGGTPCCSRMQHAWGDHCHAASCMRSHAAMRPPSAQPPLSQQPPFAGHLHPQQLPLHHQDPEAGQEKEDPARDQDPAEPGGRPQRHPAAGRGALLRLGVGGRRSLHAAACWPHGVLSASLMQPGSLLSRAPSTLHLTPPLPPPSLRSATPSPRRRPSSLSTSTTRTSRRSTPRSRTTTSGGFWGWGVGGGGGWVIGVEEVAIWSC
jgi:hypothetical protein